MVWAVKDFLQPSKKFSGLCKVKIEWSWSRLRSKSWSKVKGQLKVSMEALSHQDITDDTILLVYPVVDPSRCRCSCAGSTGAG